MRGHVASPGTLPLHPTSVPFHQDDSIRSKASGSVAPRWPARGIYAFGVQSTDLTVITMSY